MGADAKCQALTQAAGLPGTYLAWLSTANGTSPSTRFNHFNGKYITKTGVKIADNWADLVDGSHYSAINVTELGGSVRQRCVSGAFQMSTRFR